MTSENHYAAYVKDRQLIMDGLRHKTPIPLPVSRQIEVIERLLENLAKDNPAPAVQEARGLLQRYLDELPEGHDSAGENAAPAGESIVFLDPRRLVDGGLNDGIFRDIDEEELREFADNIKEIGVLQPILVQRDGTIVAGKQRVRAAIQGELDRIPAIVKEFTDSRHALQACLSENLFRRQLSKREMVYGHRALRSISAAPEKSQLVPELRSIITDPDLQGVLSQFGQDFQQSLYQMLGTRISEMAKILAANNDVEILSLRQEISRGETAIGELQRKIEKLVDQMQNLDQENETLRHEGQRQKTQVADELRELQFRLRSLSDTKERLAEEKSDLVEKVQDLKGQLEKAALSTIAETKVTQFPQEYRQLREECRRLKRRSRVQEQFYFNRNALASCLEKVCTLVANADGGHFSDIEDDVCTMIALLEETLQRIKTSLAEKEKRRADPGEKGERGADNAISLEERKP